MQEDYGGYAGRLRRLWTEEKARDRSVPDGSDKHRQRRHWQLPLASNICGGHLWWTQMVDVGWERVRGWKWRLKSKDVKLLTLKCLHITEVMREDCGGYAGRFVFVFVFPIRFWIAIIISFRKMYGLGGLGQVEVEKRRKRAKWLEKITEVMQEDYGGYAGRLRRLCREKEKARDRSVPDGSDKHWQSRHWQLRLISNIFGGHI